MDKQASDEPNAKPFTRSQSQDTYTETSVQSGPSALDERPFTAQMEEEHITVGSFPGSLTTVPQLEQDQYQNRAAFVSGSGASVSAHITADSLPETEVRRKPPNRIHHPASEESSSGEETDIPRSSSPSSSSTCSSDTATTPDSEPEHRLPGPIPDKNGEEPLMQDVVTVEYNRQDICSEICGFRSKKTLKKCTSMCLDGLKPKIEVELIPRRNRKTTQHIKVDVYFKFSEGKKTKKIIQQIRNEYRNCFTRVKIVLKDLHSNKEYPHCQVVELSPNKVNVCVQFAKVAPHEDLIRSKTNIYSLAVTLEIIPVEKIITTCDNDGVVQVDYEKIAAPENVVE